MVTGAYNRDPAVVKTVPRCCQKTTREGSHMGLSRRKYAEHRKDRGLPGGSLQAVQRALEKGRIHLELDGTIDPDRADREWAANTDLSKAPASVVAAGSAGDTPPDNRQPVLSGVAPSLSGEVPEPHEGLSLSAANAIKAVWQAKTAKLEYLKAAGEVVPAAGVRAELESVFRACRTKLLGIPNRARAAMPGLSLADVAKLEDLIREALEDLAAGEV